MRPKRLEPKSGCAAELTMSVIGGLWKPTILVNLLMGKKRFMELSRLIPDATQRVLTQQLRELEADGMITRQVFPEVPPRVEYEATDLARSVAPILGRLRDWGNQFRANQQHMDELEPYCPAEGANA
ncbi:MULTISPECIES: helix-turn-helix domain-containing protein [unclassified Rhizobium]|uniref:winged helix-turn-helix transcriptional regulator n=1 Tax=unclassified Rhizobium TaxID=2613769 RepID=UPI00161D6B9D|nr:DNA-binding HxlR family transcriptional regulator [Rhizobium sp. BK252]MBB3404446.1 DNA-binding HxlR family transcriptional regulator [Rhizobium sp. BK289]MBB3416832.1 DNA-binding HxlR family transcriptional regulator [Rhizobium sp. BK284]MBB3484709.1 DNA-binding HxlR family transcriptional regulator [Rhizobium sp. BK347]